jgi:hypothetical protein
MVVTAACAQAPARRLTITRWPGLAVARLLRLELRHNAMLWLIPLAVALFWYQAFRQSMALPPMWNLRAMTMQNDALLDFAMPVAGAAAWMGSREGRRDTTGLLTGTPRSRWTRQLVAWAATTGWAMIAYLGCVGVLYGITARQASWGGPLWWPAAVGAAGIPAITAIAFAAGAFFPSRFTPPLVTFVAFFGLGFGAQAAHGSTSYWQIMPQISGAVDLGPDAGVATFYPYLPDLSLVQVMFLAGLAVAGLGVLGLPEGSGGRWLRRCAAAITAAGLLAAGTAVALVGTARLDSHGMMIIPALHDAASDQPVRYTPVCSHSAIPVCLNPAYTAYLPAVAAALEPVLGQVAGLPGAPVRVGQAAPTFRQMSPNGISVGLGASLARGGQPAFRLVLPDNLPGVQHGFMTTPAVFAAEIQQGAWPLIVAGVVGAGPHATPAQQAISAGLLKAAGRGQPKVAIPPGSAIGVRPAAPSPASGTPAYAAAQRFAALPAAARHAWLAHHLAALRDGRITLAQLP